MKEQIIALFGSSGRGKTTTLKYFIRELKNHSDFLFKGYIDKFEGTHTDVIALFLYKPTKVLIGISTAGDVRRIIKERVENCLIKEHQCKIIFTASRTKGETCNELNQLAKKYKYSLIWVEKLYRTYDPIKESIGTEKNRHLDNLTKIEVEYLLDYLLNHILR